MTGWTDTNGVTAAKLGRDLRAGRIDPCELVERTLENIAACDDKAIFIETFAARARAEALAARKRLIAGRPASPLDGVPVGWKDLYDLEGRVTTAGSIVLKDAAPASRDAPVVAAAKRAGTIAIGATNMTEFAFSGIGLNPHHGTPRNPCDAKTPRIPGGSSSGSAVAVARGLVSIAIGSDTGGSVRVPAAFNGIVGYKSSSGHYPMAGAFPLSPSLDTIGPLATSVEDCILADAAMRGAERHTIRRRPVSTLKLIVPRNVVFDDCEDAIAANFEAALSRLAKAGAKIERMTIPAIGTYIDLLARLGSLIGAEAYHLHRARVEGPDAERMDPRVVKRILGAGKMTAYDLLTIQAARRTLKAEADAAIGDRLVAFPTVPHVAPPIAPLEADFDLFTRVNARTLRNTMIGNFLDWCGVSLPCGKDPGGLATGFLLNARHGRDAPVLAAAWGAEPFVRG